MPIRPAEIPALHAAMESHKRECVIGYAWSQYQE